MCKKRTVYFIEGLPGTGKSTICQWLHEETGAKCVLEGDLNYPNDLCNVAGIPVDIYNKICCDFPIISDFIEQHGMYIYVNIEEVRKCFPNQHKLLSILSEWDIGDEFNPHMSLSHYIPCSLEFFNNRFTQLEQTYDSIIFDSVWLQNPINELLSRNADNETIIKYCDSFARLLRNYSLTCIYLKRSSTDKTVEFASSVKGEAWTSRVIELFTSTLYGITHNLKGFKGLMEYFSVRAKIEEEILSLGIIKSLSYDVSENNWDKVKESLSEELRSN